MAKDPAILFYTSDFLTNFHFYNYEERGQFITLACYQHQYGHLTLQQMLSVLINNDNKLFTLFLIDGENKYYNPEIEEIISKRKKYSESRRKNRIKKI